MSGNDELTQIKIAVAQIDAKMDNLIKYNDKVDDVRDLAIEADNKAMLANKRMDKMDKWIISIGSTMIVVIFTAILGVVMIL